MKKGDLVEYEYLTRDSSGTGWEFHKDLGLVINYKVNDDSYVIMTKFGHVIQRLDMQLKIIKIA